MSWSYRSIAATHAQQPGDCTVSVCPHHIPPCKVSDTAERFLPARPWQPGGISLQLAASLDIPKCAGLHMHMKMFDTCKMNNGGSSQ